MCRQETEDASDNLIVVKLRERGTVSVSHLTDREKGLQETRLRNRKVGENASQSQKDQRCS